MGRTQRAPDFYVDQKDLASRVAKLENFVLNTQKFLLVSGSVRLLFGVVNTTTAAIVSTGSNDWTTSFTGATGIVQINLNTPAAGPVFGYATSSSWAAIVHNEVTTSFQISTFNTTTGAGITDANCKFLALALG